MKALDRLRALVTAAGDPFVSSVSYPPEGCQDSFEEEEKRGQLTNSLIIKETTPDVLSVENLSSAWEATDKTDKSPRHQGPVSIDPDGLPCTPCICGGLSFWRRDSAATWVCIRCAGQPATGELGEWCSLPPAPDVPTKGLCHRCGEPVAWQGRLESLRNWTGQVVHLKCPAPHADARVASDPDEGPSPDEPPPLDDDAHAQMLRDYRAVRADVTRALRRRQSDLNDPLWRNSSAEPCATCGDDVAWRPERNPRWRCRTCERPNARRLDLVWRSAQRRNRNHQSRRKNTWVG
jgi:hypothetical protein